ncbi:MAG: MFS transporter [Bacillota bacterium]|nr:MFS transporter [Bacillota bacterium]
MAETTSKVTKRTKFFYALGDFPLSFSATLIGFFLMIYLTNTIGVSAFWAGAIIFIGIFWDAVTDPIAGYLNDNVKSPLGRRRKYIILFLVPMAITFFALFSVPSLLREGTEFAKVLVTLSIYLLFTTFITLVATPFSALINDLSDDYDERTSMMTYRMIGSVLGTLIAVAIPEVLGLSNASQDNTAGYVAMGLIFAILMLVFGFASVLNLKERNKGTKHARVPFEFQKYFIASWKNPPFRQACIMFMLSIACMNFIQGNLVYFLNYKMLLPALFLPIAGGVMVFAVLFMPIWTMISRKTSKRTAYILSIGVLCVALLVMAFVPAYDYAAAGVQAQLAEATLLRPDYQGLGIAFIEDINTDYLTVLTVLWTNIPWVFPAVLLLAFGFAGLQMVPFSIVPDAINFAIGTGEKKEGAFFGVVTFVQKLGWALGMLLTGAILNWAGYIEPAKAFTADAQAEVLAGTIVLQSPEAVLAISLLFTVLPMAFGILGILSLSHYKIDRAALRERIDQNNADKEAA